MEKKKYFIDIGSGEISQIQYQNNDNLVIYATDDDVKMLRAKMRNMDGASWRSYWRSHIPVMSYHNDKGNDEYDAELVAVYQMLHDLGDDTTKNHVNSIGILGNNHM